MPASVWATIKTSKWTDFVIVIFLEYTKCKWHNAHLWPEHTSNPFLTKGKRTTGASVIYFTIYPPDSQFLLTRSLRSWGDGQVHISMFDERQERTRIGFLVLLCLCRDLSSRSAAGSTFPYQSNVASIVTVLCHTSMPIIDLDRHLDISTWCLLLCFLFSDETNFANGTYFQFHFISHCF